MAYLPLKNSKVNDIGNFSDTAYGPYGQSAIKSSDIKVWDLTPPYHTLIVVCSQFILFLRYERNFVYFFT